MNTEDTSLFSVATFLSALKNHWFASVMVFVVTTVLTILAMIFLPKAYRSDAMIFVKLGRETVALDPTATTGSTISVLESRDNEINSIRDMLYSQGIIERIVDRIGADVIMGDADLTDEVKEYDEMAEKDYLNSPRQKAIKAVIEDTYVISARKSSVLVLNAKASSPELAQRILNEYLDAYQHMHTGAHQSPESNEFFHEQSRLLRGQWQESMKALQIAKEDAGVVSIEGARVNLGEQTNAVESELMDVTKRLSSTAAKIEKFKLLVEKNPLSQQRIGDDFLEARGDLVTLGSQKETLERQLGEILAKAAKLNRCEVTIGQLEKAVDLQGTNYGRYQELYEETRIDSAMHSSRFTNIRVVQEPSFIPKAVSPKNSLLAMAGFVAASSGALLIAILLELRGTMRRQRKLSTSRRRETEVQSSLEVSENGEFLAGPSIANG